MEFIRKQKNVVPGKSLTDKLNIKQEVVHRTSGQDIWQPLLDNYRADELNKVDDSFTHWMSNELGKVDDSHVLTSSAVNWMTVKSEKAAANSTLSPQVRLDSYVFSSSLSQDQLFSIIDFSPNWAYAGSETKVMITGKFVKSRQYVSEECKWSCMFGDVEVPVEVLEHGVLRCKSPPHRDGKVPFYVTCSNRLACSEVREFEFRVSQTQDSDIRDLHIGSINDMHLHIRLGKLLSLGSLFHQKSLPSYVGEKPDVRCKISSLMIEGDGEWMQIGDFSQGEVKKQLLQKILKERMHDWLLHKATEDGKGPCVLDEEGQGVIHLSAALGFDWAIAATTTAGVNINFRDLNGWTALHWSAFYGRERTSVVLVSHGASPGALTDPTSEFPLGRTPADLASANGHKGIAGYLAECFLTTHLSFLALKDARDNDVCATSNSKASETTSGLVATPLCDGSVADVSLKGSLAAYSVADQAATRIQEALRVRSFHEKMLVDYGDDKFGMLDARALPLTSVKTPKIRQPNVRVHTAAVKIQNKFRGWKGRKEFLITRQRIIKIQAHVRGHQVRKHYRKILWSVGIVEKVILRWRRKGSGFRGFRLAADIEGTTRIAPSKDDEYDFLTEGRKQTEERLQKALTRVKSMVQYPEARDQYHRLLNVVTEFQDVKVMNDMVLNSSEEAYDNSDAMTIDFEPFLKDNTFMSTIKSLLEFDDSITSSAAAMVIHDHSIPSSSSSTLTSPKKSSRRFVQKRVVSLPIGDMYGSAMNGEGAPLSDSWAWRKYNQKLVEGSPYLRLYYRCSSSEGCPARKQVERSKEDPTMIVLTYAYEHNHPSPASRNFNPTSTAAPTTTNNNTTSTAPNRLLPEEPAVFFNQPKSQPDKKFVNLRVESLINTNDYGCFSDVASTSSTVLERPICLGSTNDLEADVAMISLMREENEPLFPDFGELPEWN